MTETTEQRAATVEDVVKRLTETGYEWTMVHAMGWGMGPAQLDIESAVRAAEALGEVETSLRGGKLAARIAKRKPAALPPLADTERTAKIMANLDRIYLAGYVTGPGLNYDEMRVASLLVADHHTDGGTRKTLTGSTRDEVFWWYYIGSTYTLMNAYGSVRLDTGAIVRPPHVCSWGCGTPCVYAVKA